MQELALLMAGFALMGAVAPRPTWALTQNWGTEEKSVWKIIEDHWAYLTSGDIEKFLTYLHPKFTGFGHESPLMIDKESIVKWVGIWIKNVKIPIHELDPIRVSVYGDFAVVHYYIQTLEKGEAKTERVIRRYTTTLINEKGKWSIIGNHNERIHGW